MIDKVTPEFLDSSELACGQALCSASEAGEDTTAHILMLTLIAEIRHQWASGWTKITDDASLPDVGRLVEWATSVGSLHISEYMGEGAAGLKVFRNTHWRYTRPMPEDG